MNTQTKHSKESTTLSTKKVYQSPQLQVLGHVRQLTLKTGSSTDGFGGTFV